MPDVRLAAIEVVPATHHGNALVTDKACRFVQYEESLRDAQTLILYVKIPTILDHRYHVARDDLRKARCPHCGAA
ncbi:hypothetical protein GC176_07915 [bacterium]|nr:hypothetical protein [bacterium]